MLSPGDGVLLSNLPVVHFVNVDDDDGALLARSVFPNVPFDVVRLVLSNFTDTQLASFSLVSKGCYFLTRDTVVLAQQTSKTRLSSKDGVSPHPTLRPFAKLIWTRWVYAIQNSHSAVVAIYNYVGALEDDELSFVAGQQLKVLKKDVSGWWQAQTQNGDDVGWIPANFVRDKSLVQPEVRALYDCAGGTDEGELTFKAGDILTLLEKDPSGSGWMKCVDEDKGQTGYVPENYFELLPPRSGIVRALHTYSDPNPWCLSFEVGEKVRILENPVNCPWWLGEVVGNSRRQGWIPSTFFEADEAAHAEWLQANKATTDRIEAYVKSRCIAVTPKVASAPAMDVHSGGGHSAVAGKGKATTATDASKRADCVIA